MLLSKDMSEAVPIPTPSNTESQEVVGEQIITEESLMSEGVYYMAIETPDQAEQAIALMMSRIETAEGDARLEIVRESLDFCIAERNSAERDGKINSAQMSLIFNDAVVMLESMIEMQSPKETPEAVIEYKLKEAHEKIEKGELIHAIPLLHTALHNAQFKRFWSGNSQEVAIKRAEIETLWASTKERWIAAGRPVK